MASRRRSKTFFKGFLGLSALAHLNLLLMISAFMSLYPESCNSDSMDLTPFEVSLVSPDSLALEAQEELEKLKEELEQEEKKEEEKEKDEKGQVVELPQPPEEKRPDKARFLAEFDSSVKKQTKGKTMPFKAGSLRANKPLPTMEPRPQQPPPPAPIPPKPPKEQPVKEQPVKEPPKLTMRTRQADVPRSDLPQSETGDAPAQVEPPGPEQPLGPANPAQLQPPGPEQPRNLRELSLKELSRALGSKVNDYLPEVEDGETTLLNSRRWRFATFFNRVKRRVAQNWHPGQVYRRRDPGGNVYGFKDRLTILRVRLTPGGQVKELHLETASGVAFLDDEALSAFRAAGPFPNPPKGLIKDDTISFRFGFLFEISRKPSFRIFKQQ